MVRNNFLDLDHMDQGMDLVGNMAMGGNTLQCKKYVYEILSSNNLCQDMNKFEKPWRTHWWINDKCHLFTTRWRTAWGRNKTSPTN